MSDDTTSDDDMSKEFDEIVSHETTADDEGVAVPVRHDTSVSEPVIPVVAESHTETKPVEPPVAPTELKHHGSGGVMVLQWLSYAFWGWLGAALTWLTGAIAVYFVTGNSSETPGLLAYPLAAVIVMTLIAFPTDMIYAKREPAQKTGGQNAIMLVHVVVFVLLAVGAAITAVFACISIMLNTDPTMGTDGQIVALWTCLSMFVAFGLLAMRVLFGGKRVILRRLYWIVIGVAALAMIVTSLVGPVAGSQSTKDDRVIEQGLPYVVEVINSYADDNGKLPTTLRDAQSSSTSSAVDNAALKELISRDMVRYTPNVKEATKYGDGDGATYDSYSYNTTTYYYRMCVTYRNVKKSSGNYISTSANVGASAYQTYLSIDSHAKGEVCYNLETNGYTGLSSPYSGADSTTGTSNSTKQ